METLVWGEERTVKDFKIAIKLFFLCFINKDRFIIAKSAKINWLTKFLIVSKHIKFYILNKWFIVCLLYLNKAAKKWVDQTWQKPWAGPEYDLPIYKAKVTPFSGSQNSLQPNSQLWKSKEECGAGWVVSLTQKTVLGPLMCIHFSFLPSAVSLVIIAL